VVPSRRLQQLALLAGLCAVYFVAGKLGLRLAFVNPSATAVWAPTGIALAAFLIFGLRVWPAILLGAFLVNQTTAGNVSTSIGIAVGNTLEGLVGAHLVNRYASGRRAFDHARDIFVLVALAAVGSTAISATVGATTLSLAGLAHWASFGPIWLTWWLGDLAGAIVVTPVVILWSAPLSLAWSRRWRLEAAALLVSLCLVTLSVFSGVFPSTNRNYPLEFLCIPFFVWGAFRFGQRAAATAILLVSGIAIWGTLHGFGPFVRPAPNESLLLLQAFVAVTAAMTLVLAAVISERKEVEAQLRHLAVSDPLTGLANYRQLVHVLEVEIQRSQRTGRPFAVLFLDVDRLKKINDRHGHLVGSRALCRLADALRASSRVIDTGARFGGDEFALILPETGASAARQVARRVVERLGKDGEKPAVSVSVGLAVFPDNGNSVTTLLNSADTALYDSKRAPR
jgi:diguanylate cyclase (GGDEF)-like protein